ncbi:hypothetical protein Dole_2156 [Desulfosudis oleivorans Hxd3]|uniref:Uncharacterized protein n=1 Tax=Desulfosudis oleivorans (strain DSM 6200 / JCM 39069 / Hxd3) TaxID=96561 RepID=A8ZUC8_DESOH|nr:hypothetical protein Dole_2156 [Desulfosudis oleivorans Hxd3]
MVESKGWFYVADGGVFKNAKEKIPHILWWNFLDIQFLYLYSTTKSRQPIRGISGTGATRSGLDRGRTGISVEQGGVTDMVLFLDRRPFRC